MSDHEWKTPEESGWSFDIERGKHWPKTNQYSYRVTGHNSNTGETITKDFTRANSEEQAIMFFKLLLPKPPKKNYYE